MKKLFVLFAFLGLVTFSANAQKTCNPAACKKAHKTTAVDAKATNTADLVKFASLDETVETRTCAKSGKVSFVRKNVCAKSGSVSYSDVEYCSKSAKFVDVSPSAKASWSKSAKASCSAKKGASAKQVSNAAGAKKACCASKAKSCGSKAKADVKSEAATTTDAKVKLISNKN